MSPLEHIALVSTPWPLYNRPSIQLGALKAYLQQEFPKLQVHTLHLYLKVAESIGYKLYRAISERTWLAETVYAAGQACRDHKVPAPEQIWPLP